MSHESVLMSSLIEALADGREISDQIDPLSLRTDERRALEDLRLLAAIAAVHRSFGAPEEPLDEDAALEHQPGDKWGHLQLIEKLGAGAFGEVWRARDLLLDADVALKLIHAGRAPQELTERVLREGRALARLHHPNVVILHGVEVHDEQLGLRMELVRGKTLEECLQTSGPLSDREASLIGQDLCRALAAVHRAGLVHRDIKAQNVIREDGGRVVLMDLGSGRLQSNDPDNRLAGTPLCIAPEVLAGSPATAQSDLYSLGVLLYHLVTDDYPVRAPSIEELRAAHAAGQRKPLYDARPDLSEGFVRVVERAIAPDPQHRFATAGEMAHALSVAAQAQRDTEAQASKKGILSTTGGRVMAAVAALLVVALSIWVATGARSPVASSNQVRRVAVLPFTVENGDTDTAHLGNGLAMELTASLGQVGGLNVVPWSFMKRVAAATLDDVARQTKADAIVEGTIQRIVDTANDSVTLRIQMFQASSGTLLWSETFQRPTAGILQLQADVARQIAGRFKVLLGRREEMLLSRFQQAPPEAVELYLKGRQAWDDYRDNFDPAINYFRQAIAISPQFADAHAALADCYTLQAAFSGTVNARDAFPRALDAANQAIALNPDLPEAYATRGYAKALLAWDWQGADTDYRRALELDPQSPAVRTSYSNFLTMVGRHQEAVEQNRVAEQRAPLSTVIARRTGWALYMGRRYDEAIVQLEAVLALEPGYSPARTLLARAYAAAGRFNDAVAAIEPVEKGFEALSAQVYAQAGHRDEALRLLHIAVQPNASANPHYQTAAAYASLGDLDSAIAYLERAFEERDPGMVNVAFDPRLDNLRSDPRFGLLLTRMQLTTQRKE